MKQIIKIGSTSKKLVVFIQDSSVTTGAGLTGLTSASSNLKWYYYREDGSTSVSVSIVAETLGTWISGGFKEIDATNLPGFYELGMPNAVIASGATWAVMGLKGATNMVPVNVEIQLVSYDPTDSVRLGLTSLPNAAAAASGGLPTVGTGTGQISLASGAVTVGTNNDKTGYALTQTFPTNFSSLAITGGGAVTSGTVNDKTGYSLTQTFPTNFSSLAISGGGAVTATISQSFPSNFASLAITSGGAVTVGTNSDKTGYSLATGQFTVKKNSALSNFTFPMYSSALGSLITTRTVVSQVSIDGGALAATTNSVVEIGSGLYKLSLTAAELNGTTITLLLTSTGAIDTAVTFITQA